MAIEKLKIQGENEIIREDFSKYLNETRLTLFMERFLKFITKLGYKSVHEIGKEQLSKSDDELYIFVPIHGVIPEDIQAMCGFVDSRVVIGTQYGLSKNSLLKLMLKLRGAFICLDRTNKNQRESTIKNAAKTLESDKNVTIFSQGTFDNSSNLSTDFYSGALKIMEQYYSQTKNPRKIKIVPVDFSNRAKHLYITYGSSYTLNDTYTKTLNLLINELNEITENSSLSIEEQTKMQIQRFINIIDAYNIRNTIMIREKSKYKVDGLIAISDDTRDLIQQNEFCYVRYLPDTAILILINYIRNLNSKEDIYSQISKIPEQDQLHIGEKTLTIKSREIIIKIFQGISTQELREHMNTQELDSIYEETSDEEKIKLLETGCENLLKNLKNNPETSTEEMIENFKDILKYMPQKLQLLRNSKALSYIKQIIKIFAPNNTEEFLDKLDLEKNVIKLLCKSKETKPLRKLSTNTIDKTYTLRYKILFDKIKELQIKNKKYDDIAFLLKYCENILMYINGDQSASQEIREYKFQNAFCQKIYDMLEYAIYTKKPISEISEIINAVIHYEYRRQMYMKASQWKAIENREELISVVIDEAAPKVNVKKPLLKQRVIESCKKYNSDLNNEELNTLFIIQEQMELNEPLDEETYNLYKDIFTNMTPYWMGRTIELSQDEDLKYPVKMRSQNEMKYNVNYIEMGLIHYLIGVGMCPTPTEYVTQTM